jgi:patatin-like phospholipase/acyl hydrolase
VIISIDGGGIRGLIPGYILHAIEVEVQKQFPDHLLADHVDMFSGTSTGGILSIGLSARIPTDKLVSIYEDEQYEDKKCVFISARYMGSWIPNSFEIMLGCLYTSKGLEKRLTELLSDKKLKDIHNDLLVMSCDVTKKDSPLGWCFTNVNQPMVGLPDDELAKKETFKKFNNGVTLVEIALSTSAAPTYFAPAKLKVGDVEKTFVDGGVIANNPAFYA